jgi:hypothetical protein
LQLGFDRIRQCINQSIGFAFHSNCSIDVSVSIEKLDLNSSLASQHTQFLTATPKGRKKGECQVFIWV